MRFEKKLIVYAIGNVASKFISVALLPIYTRYLTPEEYGRADIANSAVIIIVSITFIEVWTALLRFLYEDKNKSKVFTNVLVISVIFSIPYILVQSVIITFLKTDFVFISILYGYSFLINNLFQFMARGKGHNQLFVNSGVIASCAQVIAALVLIYWFQVGAEVILLAPSVGCFISALYLEAKCNYLRDIKWKLVDHLYIKKIIIYSVPLALNTAAFWLMSNFNKYFIVYTMGFEYGSYVSISSKFTLVVSLTASIYALAWQETAYEYSNNNEKNRYYSNMTRIYVALSAILTALCIPISKMVFPIVIGTGYHEAQLILAPYFIATYLSGVGTFLAQIFNAEKKTGILMFSTLTGSITNVVIIIMLAPKIGLLAAPVSLAFGYIVNIATRYINIRRFLALKIDLIDIIKAMSAIILSTFAYYVATSIFSLLVFTLFIVIFIVFIYKDIIIVLINRIKSFL